MRVAEISLHACPLRPLGSGDIGGMNLHVRHLSQELDKLGVEVDIFTRRHDPDEPEVMRIGERTRFIHVPAGEAADVPKMDIYNYLPEFLTNMLAFLKRDGAKYDLLHSHYWLSAVVAEQLKGQLGIPNVVTFHTLGEVTSRALATEEEPRASRPGRKSGYRYRGQYHCFHSRREKQSGRALWKSASENSSNPGWS